MKKRNERTRTYYGGAMRAMLVAGMVVWRIEVSSET